MRKVMLSFFLLVLLACVLLTAGTVAEQAAAAADADRENARIYLRAKQETGEELAETDDAVYLYIPGQHAITKIYALTDTLNIPSSLDGTAISRIDAFALVSSGNRVNSLQIQKGITSIGKSAFLGMKGLKKLVLPDSINRIEMHAFNGASSLTEIHLPANMRLEKIEYMAFYGIGTDTLVLADGTDLMAVSLAAYREEKSNQAYGIITACAKDSMIYLVREDGSAVIIDCPEYGLEKLVIPEAVNGHPIREIGSSAFANRQALTTVSLPEGLEKIGERAFCDCKSLRDISFPSTLTEIGDQAFMGVAAELTLPEGVQTASSNWFSKQITTDQTGKWKYSVLSDGTAALTDFEFTAKMIFPSEVDGYPVSEIDSPPWTSEGTEKRADVVEIVVPDGVRILGEEVFINMYNLKKVSLPEGLTRIGKLAFDNCSKLTSIVIPEGVTVIGEHAFEQCRSLKSLKLPSTLEEIHEGAFMSLYALKKPIHLPDSLRIIGEKAFYGSQVPEWTIPAGVQSIGSEALNRGTDFHLKSPKKITFLGADTQLGSAVIGFDPYSRNPYYSDPPVDSNIPIPTITIVCYPGSTADRKYHYDVNKSYLAWGPENVRTAPADKVLPAGLIRADEPVYELIIPEGVEEIADEAFKGLRLYKVSLPSTLKVIGKEAFAECVALTEIELPASLERLGESCFKGCRSLTGITVPDGVKSIPDYAFMDCKNLSALALPEGLEEIGIQAFYQDTDAVKKQYSFTEGKTALSRLKGLNLPASLRFIGDGAFAGCDALAKLSFAKNSQLEKIDGYAFALCVQLKKISLPDSVQHVGDCAFINCLNLKNANLGENILSVGNELFSGCISLDSLKVPGTLSEIGNNLLYKCKKKLAVTCPKGSAMETYMKENYPQSKIVSK